MRLSDRLSLVAGKFDAVWRLVRGFRRQIPSIGFLAAAVVFLCEASTRRPLSEIVEPFAVTRAKIRPLGYAHPIWFRRVGTDRAVLSQMLVRREYLPVSELKDVRLIVDCGANIGLSAYYLLHCYKDARLIALEPDEENCALCRQNLAPFADRVTVLQAAVWSDNRRLRIIPASRQGGAWSLEVEPWETGDVDGLTIPEALRRAGESGPIDLLKVDIEGAETEMFREPPAWLDHTRNIAIELHDAAAKTAFTSAIARYRYEHLQTHELTIVYNLRPLASPLADSADGDGRPGAPGPG